MPDALRDLVVIPNADGTDAAVLVLDRANTGGDDRDLYLRFRTPGHFALDGTTATATVGATKLAITALDAGEARDRRAVAEGLLQGRHRAAAPATRRASRSPTTASSCPAPSRPPRT